MRKFLSVCLAATLLAGATSLFAGRSVKAYADSENIIEAVAHYEFNDANNLGKDSSLNGFNLLSKDTSVPSDGKIGLSWGEEDGKTYAKFRRTNDEFGQYRGGLLYAPGISGSQDFTDLITGSYTLSLEFRGIDIPQGNGGYYLLTTGKYNNSVQITPWDDHIEVQPYSQAGAPYDDKTTDEAYDWTQSKKTKITAQTNDVWHVITICGDADANEVRLYLDGTKQSTIADDDAKVFLSPGTINRYTLCLGGQAENDGGANDCFGSADVADLRIYDLALSDENIARIAEGQDALVEEGLQYVEAVADIQSQLDKVDTLITDSNKMSDIIKQLPTSVKVTLNDGSTKKASLVWYKANSTQIKCYMQCKGYSNAKQISLSLDYGYTIRFSYDESLIRVTNVQLNGKDYVPGTKSGKIPTSSLTFEIEKVDNSANVIGFYYDDLDYDVEDLWDAEEKNYYIEVYDGANIVIYAESAKSTVTYYDGDKLLGTTTYTEGGSEALLVAPAKEGYEFVGWYVDKNLTNKLSGLDYNNPKDITLYAKYEAKGANDNSSEAQSGGGCGGAAMDASSIVVGIIAMAAALAVVSFKKKEN